MDYEKLHNETLRNLQEMVSKGKITEAEAKGICADFIPESKEEKIRTASEDLEKEIEKFAYSLPFAAQGQWPYDKVVKVASHFAQWQKQQMEAYRIKHCNSITNEQVEMESNFVSSHIDKNNRMPTFLDAIEYGMKLQREQMIKEAVEGVCSLEFWDGTGAVRTASDANFKLNGLHCGDKVKLIVIKED